MHGSDRCSGLRHGYTPAVKRAALLVVIFALGVAGVGAAYALADSSPPPPPSDSTPTDTSSTTTPTTPPTSTQPKPTPRPPAKRSRIAAGVTIAGIHVGGLAYGPAYSAISVEFRSPVVLQLGDKTITVSPWKLGAKPFIGPAVSRALHAKPGTAVKMVVDVKRVAVSDYVDTLAKHYDRTVADAHVVLRRCDRSSSPRCRGARSSARRP